ncbi:hypothetical protein Tco_0074883, partial [Tanacetum coccineum]
MATLIISISSDSLEDSVGSFTSRVVMFDDSSSSDSFVSHSSLDSHEDIPLGQPFRTHPNGVLRMLTARKRVHPFLVHILVNRRRSIFFVSSLPRKRCRASPYSSSSDSPSSVAIVAPADVPGHATRDKPVPTADHSPTPSPFTGPSPKRCRSSATLVHLATPTPGALSSARADLLLPRKRIGGPSAALSSEDNSEESMEVGSGEDIDSDVMADIK